MGLNLVADSSCDMFSTDIQNDAVAFSTVPFNFIIDGAQYSDTEDMDVDSFLFAMENCKELGSSSCPDPGVWVEKFKAAKETIAVTISTNLSGSFNSANVAKGLALLEGAKKIHVIDCKATGPSAALIINRVNEWAQAGHSFDEIVEKAEAYVSEIKCVFSLCSFDNLVKNGRMSKLAGFVARTLSMWGIGIASDEGTIIMKGKAKGKARMLKQVIEDMHERGFSGKEVIISHCKNAALAEELKKMILSNWEQAKITVLKTRGLDTFYAEREGLIISYK